MATFTELNSVNTPPAVPVSENRAEEILRLASLSLFPSEQNKVKSTPPGLFAVQGTSRSHCQKRDETRAGGEMEKHSPPSGENRTSREDGKSSDEYHGPERGHGLNTDDELLISTIVRKLCPRISLRAKTDILDICQTISSDEDFQNMDVCVLENHHNLRLFIDTILTGSIAKPNIFLRALLTICYFVKVYNKAKLSEEKKLELVADFIQELTKYDIEWRYTKAGFISLMITEMNSLLLLFDKDLTRI